MDLKLFGLLFQKLGPKSNKTLTQQGFYCEPDWITCGDPNTPARSLPKDADSASRNLSFFIVR
jgi:hypothetical protein